MSVPIVVFYHCLFRIGGDILPNALNVVREQMTALKVSGLADAASKIFIGVNGEDSNGDIPTGVFPENAEVRYWGLKCRNELRTLLMMEDFCRSLKGEAYCLYFHSKGATHARGSDYDIRMAWPWRTRMMSYCVGQWRMCVKHLEIYDAVGCHWITRQGSDHSQHYFAGNFFWVRASFFRTIPTLNSRARIRMSGLDSAESRFEAEVHIGNGPRLPTVKSYYNGPMGT